MSVRISRPERKERIRKTLTFPKIKSRFFLSISPIISFSVSKFVLQIERKLTWTLFFSSYCYKKGGERKVVPYLGKSKVGSIFFLRLSKLDQLIQSNLDWQRLLSNVCLSAYHSRGSSVLAKMSLHFVENECLCIFVKNCYVCILSKIAMFAFCQKLLSLHFVENCYLCFC